MKLKIKFSSQSPFAPQTLRAISKKDVIVISASKLSIIMPGMINSRNKEALKNLIAYLVSCGNKANKVFKTAVKQKL